MSRDNWGRLVGAVLRREELRELARTPSIDPSDHSSRFSFISSDLNSEFSIRVSSPPHALVPASRPNGSSFVDRIMPKRRLAKLREEFFRQNGGLLLEQRLRDYRANETVKLFSAKELRTATNSYNEGNIIGRGSIGTVYKGILKDNRVIVVKKLEPRKNVEQLIDEVIIVSQMNHPNLVKLLGCCLEMEVPLLVYEFWRTGTLFSHIPGTLFSHIHNRILSSDFSWEMRIKVAAETAGAIEYMHSAAPIPIVHGDVASSNILLDQHYTVRVSGFPIAFSRFDPLDASEITTTIRNGICYCDPEYLLTGRMTKKSNVYSFGVVLAELLTSQQVITYDRHEEQRHIVQYFISAIQEDRLLQIIDSNLVKEDQIEQLERFAKLTEWCLKLKGEERPSMKQVTMELEALRSEKAMDYLSNPTTSSNSNSGLLLQHQLLLDYVSSEKFRIFPPKTFRWQQTTTMKGKSLTEGGIQQSTKGVSLIMECLPLRSR